MPEMIIKCSECAAKKAEIETGNVFIVVSCEPLPDSEQPADPDEKLCRIIWRVK